MNIELLEKVKPSLRKEPRQFNMNRFFYSNPNSNIPNCGTSACIAGHTIAVYNNVNLKEAREKLNDRNENNLYDSCEDLAIKLLDLTEEQADRLFFFNKWPLQFQKNHPNNVEQACARIDHFIKTEGKE